jgi:hypothetical protein
VILPKFGVGQICDWVYEIRVIEKIEEVGPELQSCLAPWKNAGSSWLAREISS